MTVAELIGELSELDGRLEVVLSSDQEGNGFEPLDDVEETRWDGTETYHPDDWEDHPKAKPVVCLWP